ncbi:MAG: TIGR00159 family protein, partial [Myxococcota bacterium]|nr:TIGR00159 family protein [Myxococcota bacterium]
MGWLWESLRWTDALDIGLMAFIVYRTLSIMRGTRAIQSLAGLGVLVLLYILAAKLELLTIHFMLEKFFVY